MPSPALMPHIIDKIQLAPASIAAVAVRITLIKAPHLNALVANDC